MKRFKVKANIFLYSIITCLVVFMQHVYSAPINYIAVEVREKGIYIQGEQFSKTSTLSDYENKLGKPDRTSRLSNTIYTYDELGILLYQKPNQDSIISVSVDLIKTNYPFSPKKAFNGIIIVADRAMRTTFQQSNLLTFKDVEIDPDDRALANPFTKVSYGKNTIILEYLVSRKELGSMGISWRN
jgi:hypothetical protein